MNLMKSLRQGGCLALFVLCLAYSPRAAAQTPSTGWSSLDIGITLPGQTGGASDGFSVSGAGVDIWDQSDGFRYVYRPLSGDGVIITRVANFNAADPWSKAGLMIRETEQAGSKHASIFRTGTQGLVFQHRGTTNDWTAHDAASSSSAPWIKLERQGSTITGSFSNDANSWTPLGQISVGMNSTVYIGLAMTSHSEEYASVEFTNVYAAAGAGSGGGSGSAGSSGSTWQSSDIGSVWYAGSFAANGGSISLRATGADIWDIADEFRFAYLPLTGDGAIVARVTGLTATDDWTKAGVMIRESLNADSKHAFALLSGTQGLAFQRRAVGTGSWSEHTAGGWGTSPIWLKVERRGSTLTASYSGDGASWTPMGSDTISMASTVYAGVALTSHTSWAYASAEFSNVSIGAATGSTGGGSPAPATSGWTSADIGSPQPAGSTSAIEGGLALTAGGTDVWGGSDQFRFAYQQMTGDGSIIALVRGLSAADAWTKAGVMIRDTLAANSAHAFMLISGTQGSAFQRRRSTGAGTAHTSGPSSGTPFWVRLQRNGSTITGSYSWDGVNWATAGSDTITMGSTVYVGFALTSHSSASSTAHFTNASISGSGGSGGSSGGSTPPPGNQAPQVSLTSPASGATFAAPASITLTATASDPDGAVAVVEFWAGPILLGSDTTNSYSFTVNGVPAGTYGFTAVARDNSGAMTVSSEHAVYVGSGSGSSGASEAVFVPSANQAEAVSHYVLNVFNVGADPYASNPVASVDLGLPPIINGEAHADISGVMSGLPPGNYFATVTAIGGGGEATSAPSPAFSR
jgi:regulation of enolase protein 1 (concanavalin A-like superfamily)